VHGDVQRAEHPNRDHRHLTDGPTTRSLQPGSGGNWPASQPQASH
jgi:hypothetical protein